MTRTVRLRLWRAIPPRTRVVEVECLSIGRLIMALDLAATVHQLLAAAVAKGRGVTLKDYADFLGDDPARVSALAELACPRERPGFYTKHASRANNWRLICAISDTNDWPRITRLIAPMADPERTPRRGASIYSCADTLAQRYGMTPTDVMRLYVDEFVDLLQAVRDAEAREDPLSDPTVLADRVNIPGIEATH